MSKSSRRTIEVQGASVAVLSQGQQDIICLTDIAKFKNPDHPDDVIRNWLRNRSTVEFLGVWERLYNPNFNPIEFDGIRMQTGLNSFVLTPKQWNPDAQPRFRRQCQTHSAARARHRYLKHHFGTARTATVCSRRTALPAAAAALRNSALLEDPATRLPPA